MKLWFQLGDRLCFILSIISKEIIILIIKINEVWSSSCYYMCSHNVNQFTCNYKEGMRSVYTREQCRSHMCFFVSQGSCNNGKSQNLPQEKERPLVPCCACRRLFNSTLFYLMLFFYFLFSVISILKKIENKCLHPTPSPSTLPNSCLVTGALPSVPSLAAALLAHNFLSVCTDSARKSALVLCCSLLISKVSKAVSPSCLLQLLELSSKVPTVILLLIWL